jgi:flavin reductase (DIM6/NTAB) family NADH-FMN oxidoreductase RutF
MKTEIGAVNVLPTVTVLVGANVDGKPTYTTIAWVGVIGRNNVIISVNKQRYINCGIKKNQTFSVNLPSEDLVEKTDYCGIKSGKEVDKSALFNNFYGKLGTAPMIQECPVNMECRVVKIFDTPTHDVFVGEIISTHCEDSALVNGTVNLGKLKPFLFSLTDRGYWKTGNKLADAWEIGKNIE